MQPTTPLPAPIAELAGARLRLDRVQIPTPAAPRPKGSSLVVQVAALWALLQVVLPEAIRVAETLRHTKGPDRKRFVVEEAMRLLRTAEARANLLPDRVQEIVFGVLEVVLDSWLVERVFRQLAAEGAVNAGRRL